MEHISNYLRIPMDASQRENSRRNRESGKGNFKSNPKAGRIAAKKGGGR